MSSQHLSFSGWLATLLFIIIEQFHEAQSNNMSSFNHSSTYNEISLLFCSISVESAVQLSFNVIKSNPPPFMVIKLMQFQCGILLFRNPAEQERGNIYRTIGFNDSDLSGTSFGFILDLWLHGSIIILLGNFGFGTCVVIREKGLFIIITTIIFAYNCLLG